MTKLMLSRRRFVKNIMIGLGATTLAACGVKPNETQPSLTYSPTDSPASTLNPTETPTLTPTLSPTETPVPTPTTTLEPTPTLEPKPEFKFDLTNPPDSIDDIAGEVRTDHLSEDLSLLADSMLNQAKTLGIGINNVGLLGRSGDWAPGKTSGYGFIPWEFSNSFVYINNSENVDNKSRHAVLNSLVDQNGQNKGFTLSFLVRPEFGKDFNYPEIKVAHFVFDRKLFDQMEQMRQNSGVSYPPRPNLDVTMSQELSELTKHEDSKWLDYSTFITVGKLDSSKDSLISQYENNKRLYYDSQLGNSRFVGEQASDEYQLNFSNKLNDSHLVVSEFDIHPLS